MQTKLKVILFSLTFAFTTRAQNSLQMGSLSPFGSGSDYTTGTIVFSAIDVTFTAFNITRLIKGEKRKSNAAFGLVFGTAQTVYGFYNINSDTKNAALLTSVNIGLGLGTIVTSGLRLLRPETHKENNVSVNLFCLPPVHDRPGTLCFSVVRHLK